MSDSGIVAPDFTFAPHALERMAARGISTDDVTVVVHSPFHVRRARKLDRVRLFRPARVGNKMEWLVVVMSERAGVVVTAYTHAPGGRGRK